jgi:hypothetical protein
LDHITSVKLGYDLRLYPEMIAAPTNLQILPALKNIMKGVGSPPAVRPLICSFARIGCMP